MRMNWVSIKNKKALENVTDRLKARLLIQTRNQTCG